MLSGRHRVNKIDIHGSKNGVCHVTRIRGYVPITSGVSPPSYRDGVVIAWHVGDNQGFFGERLRRPRNVHAREDDHGWSRGERVRVRVDHRVVMRLPRWLRVMDGRCTLYSPVPYCMVCCSVLCLRLSTGDG